MQQWALFDINNGHRLKNDLLAPFIKCADTLKNERVSPLHQKG